MGQINLKSWLNGSIDTIIVNDESERFYDYESNVQMKPIGSGCDVITVFFPFPVMANQNWNVK